jgi:malate permease and related proteins
MPDIIEIVLPTFFVIFIGYMVGKFSKLNIAPVVDITLYIAIPALVLVSLLNKEIVLLDAIKIWGAAIIIMYGCLLVAWCIFTLMRQKHSGLYVSISMMNTVNIPFPIIYLAYGAPGLTAATLFYIPNLLSVYIFGVYTMAGRHWKENIKEIFRLPVIYAAFLGLLLNFLGFKVPNIIFNCIDLVSGMAISLVLITLGFNLSKVKIASFPTALLASFLRVGVGLGIGLLTVWIFRITGVNRSVVILDAAMPAAAAAAMLAAKYDSEASQVSSVVLITTAASVVIIPLLLNWLG